MKNLFHTASFHSNERIAPSNRGIKHLADHLAPKFAVLFDDAERGEQETVREFAKMHGWSLNNGMALGTMGQIMLYTLSFVRAKYF